MAAFQKFAKFCQNVCNGVHNLGNDTLNIALFQATAGSGATVTFTVSSGAIATVTTTPVAGGSGYPVSTTIALLVTGGGGSNGYVAATTNASGVVTSFNATPIAAGSGYSGTTGAATSTSGPIAWDSTYDDSTNFNLSQSGCQEVATGNGYTRKGISVGTVTSTETTSSAGVGTYKLVPSSGTACSWTASGSGFSLRYAVLYDETAGSLGARPVIGYWDYGSSVTINSGDGFTVSLDTVNGILQLS